MMVNITVVCESIAEIKQHLSVLQKQINGKMKELALQPEDELPINTRINDDNCYGDHLLIIDRD